MFWFSPQLRNDWNWCRHKTNNMDLIFKFIFFLFKRLYWSIVDLQCCVNFCCTAKWFNYTYICIYIHTHTLHILSHYGLSRILNIVPCSIYRTLLFSHPIYNSLHLLIPISLHFLIRLSWIINLLEMPGGGGEVFIDCNYWVGQKFHSGWFNGKMWTNLLAKPTFFNK